MSARKTSFRRAATTDLAVAPQMRQIEEDLQGMSLSTSPSLIQKLLDITVEKVKTWRPTCRRWSPTPSRTPPS